MCYLLFMPFYLIKLGMHGCGGGGGGVGGKRGGGEIKSGPSEILIIP